MPALREWQCNFPTYWTSDQARGYMHDVTSSIVQFITVPAQAVGPVAAASILLAVLAQVARANPVYAHDIQGVMANTYDLVSSLKLATEGTKH